MTSPFLTCAMHVDYQGELESHPRASFHGILVVCVFCLLEQSPGSSPGSPETTSMSCRFRGCCAAYLRAHRTRLATGSPSSTASIAPYRSGSCAPWKTRSFAALGDAAAWKPHPWLRGNGYAMLRLPKDLSNDLQWWSLCDQRPRVRVSTATVDVSQCSQCRTGRPREILGMVISQISQKTRLRGPTTRLGNHSHHCWGLPSLGNWENSPPSSEPTCFSTLALPSAS